MRGRWAAWRVEKMDEGRRSGGGEAAYKDGRGVLWCARSILPG